MKKLTAFAIAAIATSVFADKATFPYDVSMTTRIATNETVEVSDAEVELPGTSTAAGDTVAELNMSAVAFTAIDAAEWDTFVADYAGAAAMLAVKDSSGTLNWFGYSGSEWVELDGPEIDLSTTYDVKIGFDKTAGNKIRYSIASHDGTFTDNEWVAQGGSLAQLSKVVLKGTGSIDSGVLASGERGAYAQINSVVQNYSFDYSNVIFKVAVGDVTYADTLRITLSDGSGEPKVISQAVVANQDNLIDFSEANLVPGTTYDCTIEVVKENAPSSSYGDAQNVTLAATADWFGFDGTQLLKAQGTNVSIADNQLGPTNEDEPAVVTPNNESAANAKSTVEISVDYSDAFAETTTYDNVQSALALTSEGWQCLAGGDWTKIANDNVSTEAGVYATRAEFDYTGDAGKVRFSVKNGDVWYVMKNNGTEWFSLSGSATKLNGTSFVGSGKISAIAATYSSTDPIPPTIVEGKIGLHGSTDLNLADVNAGEYTIDQQIARKYSMKWTDSADKHATIDANGKFVVSSGAAANGMDSYDSYALGLDPESATSKPVLDSAQNDAADKLTMKVANVVPNADVADVTMKLVTMDAPDATTGTETPIAAGEGVQIDLPSGVKYYKVKISIKTK